MRSCSVSSHLFRCNSTLENTFCTLQTERHQSTMHGDLYTRRIIVYLCSMAEACTIFALENFFHLLTSVQSASCRLSEGLFDVCVAQWVSTCWGWHLPIASCFKPVKKWLKLNVNTQYERRNDSIKTTPGTLRVLSVAHITCSAANVHIPLCVCSCCTIAEEETGEKGYVVHGKKEWDEDGEK